MTKEQAIKEFESELEWAKLNIYPYISKQKIEANTMAIKALKQEPCEDCISRQAVLDTIFEQGSAEKLEIDFAKLLLLQRAIKALPPVTPQLKTGQWKFVHPLQEDDGGAYMCSECKVGYLENPGDWKYCPNCGVKMEVE